MEVGETARAGFPRPQCVIVHAGFQIGFDDRPHVLLFRDRQSVIHQSVKRAPHQVEAGPNNVAGGEQADQRVEDADPGEPDDPQPDEHGRRRPDIGHQVLAVGFEHDGLGFPTDSQQDLGNREVDGRRCQPDGEANVQVLRQFRRKELADGVPSDTAGRGQDQRSFQATGEKLDFLVAVGVRPVHGLGGVPQREQRGDGRQQIDDGFGGVRQQGNRPREPISEPLQPQREQRGQDREQNRVSRLRRHAWQNPKTESRNPKRIPNTKSPNETHHRSF